MGLRKWGWRGQGREGERRAGGSKKKGKCYTIDDTIKEKKLKTRSIVRLKVTGTR
jgi:hypothetical protein